MNAMAELFAAHSQWHAGCLVDSSMKSKKSIYQEFTAKARAPFAVRNLMNVGIDPEKVETKELEPKAQPPHDFGSGPRRKAWAYSVMGLLTGGIFGAVMAIFVFWIPAYVAHVPYIYLISLLGLILFVPIGMAMGLFESFKRVRRTTPGGKSSSSRPSIGVRVHSDDSRELRLAKQVFKISNLRDVRCSNGNGRSH